MYHSSVLASQGSSGAVFGERILTTKGTVASQRSGTFRAAARRRMAAIRSAGFDRGDVVVVGSALLKPAVGSVHDQEHLTEPGPIQHRREDGEDRPIGVREPGTPETEQNRGAPQILGTYSRGAYLCRLLW